MNDGGREFRGHDAIREWSDAEFIGKQVTLRISGVRVEDGTTVVGVLVGGEGFNGPSEFAFTVDGDQVTLMAITS